VILVKVYMIVYHAIAVRVVIVVIDVIHAMVHVILARAVIVVIDVILVRNTIRAQDVSHVKIVILAKVVIRV